MHTNEISVIKNAELYPLPVLNEREKVQAAVCKEGGATATTLVQGVGAYLTHPDLRTANEIQNDRRCRLLAEERFLLLKESLEQGYSLKTLGFKAIDGVNLELIDYALHFLGSSGKGIHWCTMKVYMHQEGFID